MRAKISIVLGVLLIIPVAAQFVLNAQSDDVSRSAIEKFLLDQKSSSLDPAEFGAVEIAILVNISEDANDHLRANALGVLGQIGNVEFIEPISRQLDADAPMVRRSAIRALVKIGTAETVPLLCSVLKARDYETAGLVISSLLTLASPEAISSLEEFADSCIEADPKRPGLAQDAQNVAHILRQFNGTAAERRKILSTILETERLTSYVRWALDHVDGDASLAQAIRTCIDRNGGVKPGERTRRITIRAIRVLAELGGHVSETERQFLEK